MYTISKMKIAVTKPVIGLMQKPVPVCYIGAGKIKKVADILEMNSIKSVIVVTDKSLMKLGLLDTMLEGIKAKDISVFIYDGVMPDPTYTIASEALAVCAKNRCQGVIAVGGGSVIDTAKTVAAAYPNHKAPHELEGLFKVRERIMPFIVVPTTAGTGSEATFAAVISDPLTHKKSTIVDPKIVPMCAILDPEITVGLPKHITAHTAMDALTHAVEAYISRYATAETNQYAEIAVKLIYENLENVYNNPTDIKGREALLVASFYAGMAFTRTYVGYVHAFAHNIGGKFGVPHGLANAVLLPYVMEADLVVSRDNFAALSDLLGLCPVDATQKEKAEKFVRSIFELNKVLNIPRKLDKFPASAIPEIRQAAFKECHGTYPVPRYFSAAQADAILAKVSV
ncbi:MAG: iron-containing alcohol dehydrogenase [Oscillospiraceae bacterium]